MKILIAIPCLLIGGTEMQTLSLIKSLCGAGRRVVVVCYFEFSAVVVEQFRAVGAEVLLLSPHGNRVYGWRVIPFLFKGLMGVLKRVKPDIIHVQYMAPGAIPILILRLLGEKNIIATTHTTADIYPSLKLVHFIQRHCIKAFICITKLAENSFFGSSQLYSTQIELKRRNHFTIHNALSPHITIRESWREFSHPITIGVVSRLESIKGMDLVVPAYAKIKEQYQDIKLLVVGDGSQRDLMEAQSQQLGLYDGIEWAGKQTQDLLESYYDRIDILLMPSRSEGFGLTAIEGMARGCVVVASNTGGLPEIAIDGKVALLHKSEDVEDITNCVVRLLHDIEFMDSLSIAAIKYVDRFKFENYSLLFNDLYSKL